MKKNVLTFLFCIVAIVTINSKSIAQGTLVHYWNFNNFTSTVTLPAIADLAADYTIITSPTAALIYKTQPGTSSSYSDYCDFVAGDASDTINLRMSAPSGNAFRARNPNDSMEILLYIPSTNYKNLELKYACELSSYTSGDSANVFAYSVDSGSTWITSGTGLSEWLDSGSVAFRLVSVHINDTNAYNNPKLVFRITTLGRNHTSGGNNRFDNITLDGDHIGSTIVTNQFANTALSYTLYPNPVSNQMEINTNVDGIKSFTITNTIGQIAFSGNEEGKHFSVNTANLVNGVYFITILDNNTGSVSTSKFIKQ